MVHAAKAYPEAFTFIYLLLKTRKEKETWKFGTCFVLFISLLSSFSSLFFIFFFVIEFKKNLSLHKFISPFAFLLKIVLKYIFWFCMRNNKGGNLRNDYFWRGKGEGGGGGGGSLQNRVREVDFQDSH